LGKTHALRNSLRPVFETRLQTPDLFDWHDEMQNLHQRAPDQPSATTALTAVVGTSGEQ